MHRIQQKALCCLQSCAMPLPPCSLHAELQDVLEVGRRLTCCCHLRSPPGEPRGWASPACPSHSHARAGGTAGTAGAAAGVVAGVVAAAAAAAMERSLGRAAASLGQHLQENKVLCTTISKCLCTKLTSTAGTPSDYGAPATACKLITAHDGHEAGKWVNSMREQRINGCANLGVWVYRARVSGRSAGAAHA